MTIHTPEQVLESARKLAPILRDRASQTNQARTVPRETIQDLWEIGFFGLLRPKKFGGPGVRFDLATPIVRVLAAAEGSSAWVGSVLLSHDLLVGFFANEAQSEVWDDKQALIASSLAPMGKAIPRAGGGVELTGKWQFCSGIDHSSWIVVGATCETSHPDAPPDVRYCLVRTASGTIVDDWHVLGLCGTGSKTFVVDKVVVPAHQVLTLDEIQDGKAPGRLVHDDPTFAAPMWAMLPFFVSAPAVGIARGGLEEFMQTMRSRAPSAPAPGKAALPPLPIQMRAAEAAAFIDSGELLYTRSISETAEKAAAGVPLTAEHRVRSRRDQAFSIHLAREAVRVLLDGAGGRSIYENNRLQRAFRDLQAASAHVAASWDNAAQTYGRVLFGGSPQGIY